MAGTTATALPPAAAATGGSGLSDSLATAAQDVSLGANIVSNLRSIFSGTPPTPVPGSTGAAPAGTVAVSSSSTMRYVLLGLFLAAVGIGLYLLFRRKKG